MTDLGAGRKNLIFEELETKKDLLFNVERTDKVGKNVWYYGLVEGTTERKPDP